MVFGLRRGFTGSRRGIQLRIDSDEAQVLGEMLAQLDALVGPGEQLPTDDDPFASLRSPAEPDRPEDPAVLRLFPDGYLDDPEAAGEFRRYTQGGLRRQKSERLQATLQVLDRVPTDSDKAHAVDISPDEAAAFLGTMNDLRLVLGVRLGIVADEQDVTREWAPDDPRQATFGAYQWLTWLQAGLLDAMSRGKDA